MGLSVLLGFPDGIARLIRLRDRVCRTPWCDAPVRHVANVQAHQDGGPTNEVNGQGLCESCNHAKQAAGWHAGSDQDDDTRWRPPPLPATPTDPEHPHLASNASTGHARLDLVFGALLRFAA
jgi:hypothetical protein